MFLKTLIPALLFSVGSFAHQISSSPDVFVRYETPSAKVQIKSSLLTALAHCRDNIYKIMCLVDPVDHRQSNKDPYKRPCLPNSREYAYQFVGHFDTSPEYIQKMYCHLDRIWIEKDFYATAYATPTMDPKTGKVIRAGIGVREELFYNRSSMDDWMSWKEETSFGGTKDSGGQRLGLINYHSNRNSKDFFFDYVVNHEFGHIFDFTNQLNKIEDCDFKETSPGNWQRVGKCTTVPNSWSDLSWKDIEFPKPEMDYELREKICFYSCKGKYLDHSLAPVLFRSLTATPFVSVYASTNLGDDFAETFAMYHAHEHELLQYSVSAGNETFDLSAHYRSPQMKPKLEYVRNFIKGKILYPGQD